MKRTIKVNGVSVSFDVPFGTGRNFGTTQALLGKAKEAKYKVTEALVATQAGEIVTMPVKEAKDALGIKEVPTQTDEATITGNKALDTSLSALRTFYGINPPAPPAPEPAAPPATENPPADAPAPRPEVAAALEHANGNGKSKAKAK